ncbi:MAG: hypothetical protein NTY19_19105 [Planctomycetota bacterium]|nr:hypothetical protein [Planctomycetota bacterium]
MQRPSWQWEKSCLSCGNATALLAAAALAATPPPAAKVLEMLLVRVGSDLPEASARMGAFTAAAATLWAAGTAAVAFGFAALLRAGLLPVLSRRLVLAAGVVGIVAVGIVAVGIVVVGQWHAQDSFAIYSAKPSASVASTSASTGSPALLIQIGYGVLGLVPVLLAAASLTLGSAVTPTAQRRGDLAPLVLAVVVLVLGVAFALLHLLSWHQATALAEQVAGPQPVSARTVVGVLSGLFHKSVLAGIALLFQGVAWVLMGCVLPEQNGG